MKVQEMTKEDFEKVPGRERFDSDVGTFNSLVIIPTDKMHDSGYLRMDFVAVDDEDEPIALLSGCSDVLHIDGIGGYGRDYRYAGIIPFSSPIPIRAWSIDCLPKSGYLRLFCKHDLTCGAALSSFEVFSY